MLAQPESSEADTTIKIKSPTGALLRSLVVPGWGQFYNQKYIKTGLVATAEISLLAAAIVRNNQAQKSASLAEKDSLKESRNTFVVWLMGTVLYSIIDAYVDAHLYDFEEKKGEGVEVSVYIRGTGLAIRMDF